MNAAIKEDYNLFHSVLHLKFIYASLSLVLIKNTIKHFKINPSLLNILPDTNKFEGPLFKKNQYKGLSNIVSYKTNVNYVNKFCIQM